MKYSYKYKHCLKLAICSCLLFAMSGCEYDVEDVEGEYFEPGIDKPGNNDPSNNEPGNNNPSNNEPGNNDPTNSDKCVIALKQDSADKISIVKTADNKYQKEYSIELGLRSCPVEDFYINARIVSKDVSKYVELDNKPILVKTADCEKGEFPKLNITVTDGFIDDLNMESLNLIIELSYNGCDASKSLIITRTITIERENNNYNPDVECSLVDLENKWDKNKKDMIVPGEERTIKCTFSTKLQGTNTLDLSFSDKNHIFFVDDEKALEVHYDITQNMLDDWSFSININAESFKNIGNDEITIIKYRLNNQNIKELRLTVLNDALNHVVFNVDNRRDLHQNQKAVSDIDNLSDSSECGSQVTVPAGKYKLEVWGASGYSYYTKNTDEYVGGKGGYSTCTILLGQETKLYLYYGTEGKRAELGDYAGGGCNGGGNGYSSNNKYAGGGGGASDIRIDGYELYNRIIVAGGGGGADYGGSNGYLNGSGGVGGGTSGGDGKGVNQNNNDGIGGKISSGNGFGKGGGYITRSDSYYSGGGGGGGWFGGYAGHGSSAGGGGGSGFVLNEYYIDLIQNSLFGNNVEFNSDYANWVYALFKVWNNLVYNNCTSACDGEDISCIMAEFNCEWNDSGCIPEIVGQCFVSGSEKKYIITDAQTFSYKDLNDKEFPKAVPWDSSDREETEQGHQGNGAIRITRCFDGNCND